MNRAFGFSTASLEKIFERKAAEGFLPRGYIDGLTIANDTTDATNDIVIQPGVCRSTVNKAKIYNNAYSTIARDQRDIEINDSLIKQLDVVWAPGTNVGGRSASSLSDATWHVIAAGGKGLKDTVFLHDSATQSSVLSAMPGGYTAYRRIGSIIRDSGAILGFTQFQNGLFLYDTPILTVDNTSDHTTPVTPILDVPIGVSVLAIITVAVNDNAGGSQAGNYVSATAQTANEPVQAAAPGFTAHGLNQNSIRWGQWLTVPTSTAGLIRYEANIAAVDTKIVVHGWFDHRDNDS